MSSLRRLSLVIALLCIAAPLAAQTTGSISGSVTDPNVNSIPGVTVQATSSSLQGTRTAQTDYTGIYRLPLLPPGDYTVSFTMEGFAPMTRRNVTVSLGRDT